MASLTIKSALGIELAKKYNGEIISADSRQIYKGFDLCCGKVTKEEREAVPHALHVFIHAATAYKADRIVRLYGESEKKPEERLADKDGKRRAHYKHFTGREWGRCQNYHLSLDSSLVGIERCVEIIISLSQQKKEN